MNALRPLLAIGMLACLSACSTVTPYTPDLAKQSGLFGHLTPEQAAKVVAAKVRVSGEDADSGTFLTDKEGFSYTKTTKTTKTKWKHGKPVETEITTTTNRNVPWSAVVGLDAYREAYQWAFLGTFHRARIMFDVVAVEDARRVRERHELRFTCRKAEDLADVLAALSVLRGK